MSKKGQYLFIEEENEFPINLAIIILLGGLWVADCLWFLYDGPRTWFERLIKETDIPA